MATSVANVVSHFPEAENGFTTTLASTISSGATTVPLNSVAGYSNGQPAVFVVDPADTTKKQTFTGIIDTAGVQVNSVVWTAGTNQTHTGGATVVDYATATHISMMSKGILVHADQDGTLKAGAVDNAAVLASDVVTTAKILDSNVTTPKLADGAVTPAKLLTGTGTSWDWSTYTPTLTNFTLGNGTVNYARYQQVGKFVRVSILVTLGSTSSMGTQPTISLPVTSASHYVTDKAYLGFGDLADTGTADYPCIVSWKSTTTVALFVMVASGTYTTNGNVTSTVPMTWTTGDRFSADFSYEAA